MIRNNSDLPRVAKKCPKTKSMVTAPTRPQAEAIHRRSRANLGRIKLGSVSVNRSRSKGEKEDC
jgi:hypothetical protein